MGGREEAWAGRWLWLPDIWKFSEGLDLRVHKFTGFCRSLGGVVFGEVMLEECS